MGLQKRGSLYNELSFTSLFTFDEQTPHPKDEDILTL